MKLLNKISISSIISLFFILLVSLQAIAASPDSTSSKALSETVGKTKTITNCWTPPPDKWVVYLVLGFIIIAFFVILYLVRISLSQTTWSLGDALSEEVEITFINSQKTVELDKNDKPVMVTEMRASVSRLIALMGMVAILLMFLGFGIFTLNSFAYTGEMPASTDSVIKFLSGGLALFAPYLVNKFSGVFDNLSPKKK
ncbi:MAG: hypothetical protein HKK67_00040 [Chlorobiaceae bacterium]|nr:hypothetical protein [Chlorobiaceae bacterium]